MTTEDSGLHRDCAWRKALEKRLHHASSMWGMHALVLADRFGVVLAGSHHNHDLNDILAAYAPLLSRREDLESRKEATESLRREAPETHGRRLKIRPFERNSEMFYLCALIDNTPQQEQAMRHALAQVVTFLGH